MCERLQEPSSRHALGHVVAVEIGRSAARELTRADKRLTLGIPDPRASGKHARISRVLDGWMIEDLGSRNGTAVNGKREARALLQDGDLIELGRSFFLFRERVAVGDGAPDVDAPAALPGLSTLLPSLAEDFTRLGEVARARLPVLVQGESGTGKELVARAVHKLSGQKGAFIAVSCGALPPTLVESELFGAQKGAFSGADRDRPGLIRAADGGTLFLDEIGELPAAAQVALLRVLQEREVTPVGGIRPVRVELGLVTATHRDLPAHIAAGGFRADLFARIAGHRLELPPLRERREDLGIIIGALLARGDLTLSPEAARALFAHSWPLNVRELEQCLLRAVAVAPSLRLERDHLTFMPAVAAAPRPAPVLTPEDEARRDQLVQLLTLHKGNITRVAEALGKERMQVHRWLKRYQLDLARFRV